MDKITQSTANPDRKGGEKKHRDSSNRLKTTQDPVSRAGKDGLELKDTTIAKLYHGPGLEEERTVTVKVSPERIENHIYLRSTSKSAVCPHCGTLSSRTFGWSQRNPRGLTLNGKTTISHVKSRRYRCECKGCKCKTFTEELPSIARYKHFYDITYLMAFIFGSFFTAEATSFIMTSIGIPISDDAVRGLMDRLVRMEDVEVEEIGIDDVCHRRGKTYYTIVYDAKTHVPLALLPGRGGDAVKEWLEWHKNIKKVNRDRASPLVSVFKEMVPDCLIVADRFHLIANLLEEIKEIMSLEFPEHVYVKDGELVEEEPEKVNVPIFPIVEDGYKEAFDKFGGEDGTDTGIGVIDASSHGSPDTEMAAIAAENRSARHSDALRVRKEWEDEDTGRMTPWQQNRLMQRIGYRTGLKTDTVRRYIKMTEGEVEALLIPPKPGGRKPLEAENEAYGKMVYRMLDAGYQPGYIFSCIASNDPEVDRRRLISLIANISRNHFSKGANYWSFMKKVYPEGTYEIARGTIIKYMTIRDKEKMGKSPVAKYFDKITARYPIVSSLQEIWNDFGEVFQKKKAENLGKFLDKYECSMITPLVEGIRKDLAAVENAITDDSSSGFVESGNNLYQRDKRNVGGHASIELLGNRLYVQAVLRKGIMTLGQLFRDFHKVTFFPDAV